MTLNRLRRSVSLFSVRSDGIVHSVKSTFPCRPCKRHLDERLDLTKFENLINLEASVTEKHSCRLVTEFFADSSFSHKTPERLSG